jgi:hypothetical protein
MNNNKSEKPKFVKLDNKPVELHIGTKTCNGCCMYGGCPDSDNGICDDWDMSPEVYFDAFNKLSEEDKIKLDHPATKFIIIEDNI